jgi:hypothetical protein
VIRIKKQHTEWEKIFLSFSSDKELISGIYKELQELNTKKITNAVRKWANQLKKYFSEEEQIANKYMNKYSTSLAIKEMQIKTTLRFHITPVRMPIIKETNKKCW